MLTIQSEKQAIEILNDCSQSVTNREAAIHYLQGNPSSDNIAQLVKALEDDHFGVRWTAASVLARMGNDSLSPLLHVLVEQHDSAWLREGAHHVLHYSSSQTVREQSTELQKALRGPAAEVVVTNEAAALLKKLLS